ATTVHDPSSAASPGAGSRDPVPPEAVEAADPSRRRSPQTTGGAISSQVEGAMVEEDRPLLPPSESCPNAEGSPQEWDEFLRKIEETVHAVARRFSGDGRAVDCGALRSYDLLVDLAMARRETATDFRLPTTSGELRRVLVGT